MFLVISSSSSFVTNWVTHQIGQEQWLCSLHNPPSIVIFSMYDTVAYCQLYHIFILFNFSFAKIMHNCFIYKNCSQSLLHTPWFGAHKCWKIPDCLRLTATLYHLITKEYSLWLCLLPLLYIFCSPKIMLDVLCTPGPSLSYFMRSKKVIHLINFSRHFKLKRFQITLIFWSGG